MYGLKLTVCIIECFHAVLQAGELLLLEFGYVQNMSMNSNSLLIPRVGAFVVTWTSVSPKAHFRPKNRDEAS